ncbi:MAG: 23S rRNA (uracil(1939)-C(5))-methyltransferase RlmD [Clostridia bacterium]|nr:23S rRNA (uracil(1939)-C(5))-methyltransferase RlmD [Clostridia bacterium]
MPEKKCKFYKKCGGCQLDMPYEAQLEYKMKLEQKLLGKFGNVSPIIGMYYPYHYRNKVQAAFYKDARSGQILSGVYQSNSKKIVPVDTCMIEDKKADEIIQTIRKLTKDFRFLPRHVLVKHSPNTNEIMVVVVTDSPILPAKKNFCKALKKAHPEITTIIHNINPYDTSLVLGPREEILFGLGYITDKLLGCTFRISAKSFYQINSTQTEKLYTTALKYADLNNKTVLDAYCGTGTIGILAAKHGAAQVIGVELEKSAVKDAIQNAKQNQIKNIHFCNADATEFITELAQNKETVDVVILDPPRAGSTEAFLDAVAALSPQKIVYVSCNPETLQRDLDYITKKHYKVTAIQPVDMFPHTTHIETVVSLDFCI